LDDEDDDDDGYGEEEDQEEWERNSGGRYQDPELAAIAMGQGVDEAVFQVPSRVCLCLHLCLYLHMLLRLRQCLHLQARLLVPPHHPSLERYTRSSSCCSLATPLLSFRILKLKILL